MTAIEEYCEQQRLEYSLFEQDEKYYVKIKIRSKIVASHLRHFVSHHHPESREVRYRPGHEIEFCLGTVFDIIQSSEIKPQTPNELLASYLSTEIQAAIDEEITRVILYYQNTVL